MRAQCARHDLPPAHTVFVAGDSTAATWPAATHPKAGWGQALPAFLDQRRLRVTNLALSGASSKSFVEAGLLDQILAAIRPGDYLLIGFGAVPLHHDDDGEDGAGQGEVQGCRDDQHRAQERVRQDEAHTLGQRGAVSGERFFAVRLQGPADQDKQRHGQRGH